LAILAERTSLLIRLTLTEADSMEYIGMVFLNTREALRERKVVGGLKI
jgi:hypothetical protein